MTTNFSVRGNIKQPHITWTRAHAHNHTHHKVAKRRFSLPFLSNTNTVKTNSSLSVWITNQHDGAYDTELPILPVAPSRPTTFKGLINYRRRPPLAVLQKKSNHLQSPDRFVPTRRSCLGAATETFRSSKDLSALTPEEKLLRHEDASLDAFNPRRRVTSPLPRATRLAAHRSFSGNRSGGGGASTLTFRQDAADLNGVRQVSVGTVWTVGGLAPVSTGVPDGRGGLLGSGTNAPLYTTTFSSIRPKAKEDLEMFEARLATALELNRAERVFQFRESSSPEKPRVGDIDQNLESNQKTSWKEGEWTPGSSDRSKFHLRVQFGTRAMQNKTLSIHQEVLDAPNLRDDFYCSVLAYSLTCHTLAVGLGSLLYAWSEMQGVHLLNSGPANGSWLTTLGFSSTQGQRSILAFGRSDGSLSLMSLYDSLLPRFEIQQPCPVACIAWRPDTTMRPSKCPVSPGVLVNTEDLAVGDEVGSVYYYSVEWPEAWEVSRHGWSGSLTLLFRISVHTQQICGLSFSHDGKMFATGGNDNLCCLFRTRSILECASNSVEDSPEPVLGADGIHRVQDIGRVGGVHEIRAGAEKHRWIHGAAVKAIAFCPWRDGLVATGGGSNDKCIHFFHTTSGACLATISVSAQVTSLIWSTTRREIVATFGYAQPEHPYRIAVFSWPECKQVAAIPWDGEHRALYAIPYPVGPNESQASREGSRSSSRNAAEGCIVVASSDESVKFHEVWTSSKKATRGGDGLLGGSKILEGLEGIDKEGETIR